MSARATFTEVYRDWPPKRWSSAPSEGPPGEVFRESYAREGVDAAGRFYEIPTPTDADPGKNLYDDADAERHERRDQARHRSMHRDVTCPNCQHTFRLPAAREAFRASYRRRLPLEEVMGR